MSSARLRYDRKGTARQLSIRESTLLDILTAKEEVATMQQGKQIMYLYAELRRFSRKSHLDPIRGKRSKKPTSEPTPEPSSESDKAA
jgi:hypothetical protein